jgi:hypothetical protein
MAKAKAVLILKLEAYEASALLAFLTKHEAEFEDPDLAGGEELANITEVIAEAIPEMSFVPPIEDDEEGEEEANAE